MGENARLLGGGNLSHFTRCTGCGFLGTHDEYGTRFCSTTGKQERQERVVLRWNPDADQMETAPTRPTTPAREGEG